MFVEKIIINEMMQKFIEKYSKTVVDDLVHVYTDLNDEYNSLKYGVGLIVDFNREIIQLTGKDTLDFLHRISTNNLTNLKPGFREQTLFLNEKGRFVDRTVLLNLEEKFLLISSFRNDGRLLRWLNKFIITEDINTQQVTSNYVIIDFFGSQTESFLSLLFGDDLKLLNGDNILSITMEEFHLNLFSLKECNGNKFYRILISSEKIIPFIDFILDNKSVFDVSLVGNSAFEIYRIENGIPAVPNEINLDNNPHETNLLCEVSFTKGCYIGQEVIARIETYDKVQNSFTGFIIDKKITSELPLSVMNENNEEVGLITSSVHSLMLEKQIGIGFIKRRSRFEKLSLNMNSERVLVSLSELPFTK